MLNKNTLFHKDSKQLQAGEHSYSNKQVATYLIKAFFLSFNIKMFV
jgi:hypothetical protein